MAIGHNSDHLLKEGGCFRFADSLLGSNIRVQVPVGLLKENESVRSADDDFHHLVDALVAVHAKVGGEKVVVRLAEQDLKLRGKC